MTTTIDEMHSTETTAAPSALPRTAAGTAGPGGRFATKPGSSAGDRALRSVSTAAAAGTSALVLAIGAFLLWRAVPSLRRNEVNFLTSGEWSTTDVEHLAFGIADLLQLTVLVSVFALAIAMPVSFGIAVYTTRYASARPARAVAFVVDLLAAVPSVVYGLWGLLVLAPALAPVATWLNATLGWLPLFAAGSGSISGGGTVFTASIVLAVMIVPVITGVTREVFAQTPRAHVEAALALGATRWEVVRQAVLPFGRSGFIGASMLGLGRALGETMALYMVLQTTSAAFGWSLFDAGATIASKIALGYAEFSSELQAGAYIAAGLVLFAVTFVVGAGARMVAGHGGTHRPGGRKRIGKKGRA